LSSRANPGEHRRAPRGLRPEARARDIILSGRSYETFSAKYKLLNAQLDVLLRQRPVLFLGCSLQDPRILDWLAGLSDDAAEGLEIWRALMLEKAWTQALAYTWDGGHASGALSKGKVRPLILSSHDRIAALLGEVAADHIEPSPRLAIDIHVDGSPRASLASCADWPLEDPHADPTLAPDLATLRALDHVPLETDERGALGPAMATAAAQLRVLAERAGDALTAAILSLEARQRIAAAIRASAGKAPPLLLLRVHAGSSDEARRHADRLLALPWELLRIDGEFPLEHGKLDLAREAVVDGALRAGGVAGRSVPVAPGDA
jgi:hypothetical protein